MKITNRQLRRIIREAETAAAENAALIGVESPYEVEPVEDAWAGGDDLINPIDQAEAAGYVCDDSSEDLSHGRLLRCRGGVAGRSAGTADAARHLLRLLFLDVA